MKNLKKILALLLSLAMAAALCACGSQTETPAATEKKDGLNTITQGCRAEGVSGWWVAAAIGLYSPLSELFTYKKRLAELDAEAEASDRRLHDPEYAATLKRLGYAVPEKYLVQKQPK